MIANRTEFLEAIIRKLLTQVEIYPAWEDSNGRKYQPNADGYDSHGGVSLTPEEYEALTAIMNAPTRPAVTIWSQGGQP